MYKIIVFRRRLLMVAPSNSKICTRGLFSYSWSPSWLNSEIYIFGAYSNSFSVVTSMIPYYKSECRQQTYDIALGRLPFTIPSVKTMSCTEREVTDFPLKTFPYHQRQFPSHQSKSSAPGITVIIQLSVVSIWVFSKRWIIRMASVTLSISRRILCTFSCPKSSYLSLLPPIYVEYHTSQWEDTTGSGPKLGKHNYPPFPLQVLQILGIIQQYRR